MATPGTPGRAVDPREKIIKSGVMKHRQTGIGLMRWRQRYVVFKITNSGRLQFVLYKEQPAVPDNEVKHVAIEEYGGLETNLKLENEIYTFAIITSNATDCFSTDTPKELTDWTNVIQEYLGKEMVLSITIPSKQNVLRSGKAHLRIRNTGFTITSCDNPPRCQGTWQIIHIRKYGGTDTFKFQTGSKCPSGEHLYNIQTDDNLRVKSLFNDLSQHKPIFDDRVGRRMTLERSFNSKTNTIQPHTSNRLSLQNTSTKDPAATRLYENRDAVTVNGDQLGVGRTVRRHSATGGGEIFNPLSRTGAKLVPSVSQTSSLSIEDLPSRLYQNVNRQSSHAGRVSPTKKLHHQVPLPEDYYNVTPPQVVQKKYRSSNSTPCSSPEDDNWLREHFLSKPSEDDYSKVTPSRSSKVLGEHIVFHDSFLQHDLAGSNPNTANGHHEGGQYQNLQFLQGNQGNRTSGSAVENVVSSPRPGDPSTQSYTPQPSTVGTSDQDWSPHNYTNVQLAVEAVHGKQHRKLPVTSSSFVPSVDSSMQRKTSTPSYWSGSKELFDVPSKQNVHSGLTETKSLSIPVMSPLRNSHSNFELNKKPTESLPFTSAKANLPEYYNIFVPDLPANSPNPKHPATSTRNSRVTVKQQNDSLPGNVRQCVDFTDSPQMSGGDELSAENTHPTQSTHITEEPPRKRSVNGLEYSSTTAVDKRSKTHVVSNYDSLTPIVPSECNNQQHYDSLRPLKSSSSSPEPLMSPTDSFSPVNRYDRKVKLTQHPHKYEYIDVDINHSGESVSSEGVFSPSNSMEHPLTWMSPPPTDGGTTVSKSYKKTSSDEEANSITRASIKEPKTKSRRKQLPLQTSDENFVNINGATRNSNSASSRKPRAPRLSRVPLHADSIDENPKLRSKPVPLPRVSPQTSANHLHTQNRHSASSDDSNSSFEVIPPVATTNRDSAPECISPSQGHHHPTHEEVSLFRRKISSIHVEVIEGQGRDSSNIIPPPLPPRKAMDGTSDAQLSGHDFKVNEQSNRNSSSSDIGIGPQTEIPSLPPRPQEGAFKVPLPQAHFDFEITATPPKPRVLCANDQQSKNYLALTFGEQEDSNGYTEVKVNQQAVVPSTPTEQADSRVSYAAVSFQMTEALRNTKEEVDDKKREFISATKRH